MTREEAVIILDGFKNNPLFNDTHVQALDMAISALKDIEKIQTIIDNYFTIGRKSGYECMGEIDSILEPYKKGDGK